MSQKWHTIASRKVGSERKVPIPEDVSEVVANEKGTRPFVWWNYERNSKYIVISNEAMEKDNYKAVDTRRISPEGGYPKIRPPVGEDEFPDMLSSLFYKGNELFFLIYEDMAEEEKDVNSAFLLTRDQVLKLLPAEAQEDDSDLTKRILNTPGFLPSI